MDLMGESRLHVDNMRKIKISDFICIIIIIISYRLLFFPLGFI